MLAFSQVDVFTDELTRGNPVAVVHSADELSEDQMAAFARWTNLSETTFLLKPNDRRADYRLRIFTLDGELPFAGHPTLGSARAWLEAGGHSQASDGIVQECGAGLVKIRRDGDLLSFAAPALSRDEVIGPADRREVADALGISFADVVDARLLDNGPGWLVFLVRNAKTVLQATLRAASLGERKVGLVGPYPEGSEVAFELRAFAPAVGVPEDPVTGSLNAAAAQWLMGTGRAPATYVASQGTRLGRRGRIHVRQERGEIWVGGGTVLGVEGHVALSPGSA